MKTRLFRLKTTNILIDSSQLADYEYDKNFIHMITYYNIMVIFVISSKFLITYNYMHEIFIIYVETNRLIYLMFSNVKVEFWFFF